MKAVREEEVKLHD